MNRISIIAVVVAAGLLSSGCSDNMENIKKVDKLNLLERKSRTIEPVPVRVMTVEKSRAVSTTNYVGTVEPSKNVVITNPFPGKVEKLYVKEGARVKEGTVIARISSEALQSAYDIAKATLEQAEDGLRRAEKVYGTGSVTEVKMVEIRTQVEKARAAEKSAEQALEDCNIKAPFSGVVDGIYVHEGQNVTVPSPVVQILSLEGVEIHFKVPENEYAKVHIGCKVEIDVPALDRKVTGNVAVKGIKASPLSHAYDFTIKGISDSRDMAPGMVCKVRALSTGEESIVIPASAVMTDMEGRYIWGVTQEDTVCKTYVTVGGFMEKGVEISEGLVEGDRVIIEGSRKVSTGMKVKALE
ncbi:MAG: efflux RND transporter periplasmic adaptor subunit [Bacteroidales bacterium]|nr:efflux RND transporter periplasmic adaptor subunit [Candidatus Cacconaster merdequi]